MYIKNKPISMRGLSFVPYKQKYNTKRFKAGHSFTLCSVSAHLCHSFETESILNPVAGACPFSLKSPGGFAIDFSGPFFFFNVFVPEG